jgi:hypothetical protein
LRVKLKQKIYRLKRRKLLKDWTSRQRIHNHQPQSLRLFKKRRREESELNEIHIFSKTKICFIFVYLNRRLPSTPTASETTPKPQKNPVGRPRIHPLKTPTSTPRQIKQQQAIQTPLVESDESEHDDDALDVPGKKSKINPRNNQKSLNSTPSNRLSSNYNNIMLIKNEQIVSNSSSLKQLKAQNNHLASSPSNSKTVTHQQGLPGDAFVADRQQQNPPSSLGVSDRMSKEKQKFFRYSVFNSERKTKTGDQKSKSSLKHKNNNTNNHEVTTNGGISDGAFDKYKFVSSSDSERDEICDKQNKNNKAKGRNLSGVRKKTLAVGRKMAKKQKMKEKGQKKSPHLSSDDSSCCSSDGESGSSSDSSSSSSGSSTSSSSSSSSANSSILTTAQSSPNKASLLANKAEAINTMNVFACINSRELTSQAKRPPYCWSSMPFPSDLQSDLLFKKHSTKSKSFGANSKNENEVWGFAAEAKKTLNIFNNSDSESRTHRLSNFSGNESDCHMSLLSMSSSANVARSRMSRSNRDAGSSRLIHQMPLLAPHSRKNSAHEYLLSNHRTTTLMRNNTIMSSDDDVKQKLSPSKLVRKAVNYKKFDNNTLNNKKLIMDTSLNGAKYGSDDRPVKEPAASALETSLLPPPPTPESSKQSSQPPYNNNTNNQSDMGKKLAY